MDKAKTRGRPKTEEDVLDRAERVALGVIRVMTLIKTVNDMEDGPARRGMMALVDRMVEDLERIPL